MIALTAFDAALGRKPHEVIQEAKRMASQIQESSDLWDLERHQTQRSKRSTASTLSVFAAHADVGETSVRKATPVGFREFGYFIS
jgi:hypothetical protein